MIGWPEGGTHYAQHALTIGETWGGVPSSIQSLFRFFRESGSNSAQKPLLTLTGLRTLTLKRASHPGVSLFLSPGLCSPLTSALACTTSSDSRTGYVRVYPGCIGRVYTRVVYTSHIPGWCIPGGTPLTYPGIPQRYISHIPGYTTGCTSHTQGVPQWG